MNSNYSSQSHSLNAVKICNELYEIIDQPSIEQRWLYNNVINDMKLHEYKNNLTKPFLGRDKFLIRKHKNNDTENKHDLDMLNISHQHIMHYDREKQLKIYIFCIPFIILIFNYIINLFNKN